MLVHLAAIIIQANDLFSYTPEYAVGAIGSEYIPYGTYTRGSGSTEYLRISTNLVGVLSSVWDGAFERTLIPEHIDPDHYMYRYTVAGYTNDTRRILDVLNATVWWQRDLSDFDNPLVRVYGNSLEYRLAHTDLYSHDGIAAGYASPYLDEVTGNAAPPISSVWSSDIPFSPSAASEWRHVFPVYSACQLDAHFWESNRADIAGYHYKRPEMRAWMDPAWIAAIWNNNQGDVSAAVMNLYDANIVHVPLANTIEDVLKIDPGWKYEVPPELTNDYWMVDGRQLNRNFIDGSWDDLPNSYYALWSFAASNFIYRIYWLSPDEWQYEVRTYPEEELVSLTNSRDQPTSTLLYFEDGSVATKIELYDETDDFTHWRNMTRRFDWKRLAIICQLERHMETTYRARDREDAVLPFWYHHGQQSISWRSDGSDINFYVTNRSDTGRTEVTIDPINAISWVMTTNIVVCYTNHLGSLYPTARAETPALSGTIAHTALPPSYYSVPPSDFLSKIQDCTVNAPGWEDRAPWGSLAHYRVYMYVETTPARYSPSGCPEIYAQLDSVYWIRNDGYSTNWWASGGYTWIVTNGLYVVEGANLTRTYSKSADEWFTTCPLTGAYSILPLLSWEAPAWPARLWDQRASTDWVASVYVPNLELMLTATNIASLVSGSTVPMTYSQLQGWLPNDSWERLWRYAPIVECTLSNECARARALSLSRLNDEVASQFARFAGVQPGARAAGAAQLNAADIQQLNRLCDMPENMHAALTLRSIPSLRIEVTNDGRISDIFVQGTSDRYTFEQDPSGNYIFGDIKFQVESNAHGYADDAVPVRVDAHQDQLIKTHWKFRNLRNPDL